MALSSDNQKEGEPLASTLWSERLEYFDLNGRYEEASSEKPRREIPLFLLGGAFYPQGMTFLNIFEMKYRTMMFDCSQGDDFFGYIHSDGATGRIATVGTLCKIVDRQLLEDGRQYIALEGVSRFKVTKILKTLPYILAEVELDYEDAEEDEAAASLLEQSVYGSLKYYMRLMKSYPTNKEMVVSQALKNSRLTSPDSGSADSSRRRTDFSFALANMIQMTHARESQLILQTTSISKRLGVEQEILQQAATLVAEKLIEMGNLTPEQRDDIRDAALGDADFDTDILPAALEGLEAEEEKDEWDINNME